MNKMRRYDYRIPTKDPLQYTGERQPEAFRQVSAESQGPIIETTFF